VQGVAVIKRYPMMGRDERGLEGVRRMREAAGGAGFRRVSEPRIVWKPQPRQEMFMARPEYEALYGGAAGGGKSDALLAEGLRQVEIPHYRGLILRKTFPQLMELIDRSRRLYGGSYRGAVYNQTQHIWRFPSGAMIRFGAMQHEGDRTQYQGQQYDYIAFDELTHFTWAEYAYLFSRNRAGGPGTRVYMRRDQPRRRGARLGAGPLHRARAAHDPHPRGYAGRGARRERADPLPEPDLHPQHGF